MKKIMIASLLMTTIALSIISCRDNKTASSDQPSEKNQAQLIKRGAYLVTITGCNDCHTPKIMTERGPGLDSSHLLAGHISDEPVPEFDLNAPGKGIIQSNMKLTAWRGPWGTSFTANLTPDVATGIGSWTLEQFKTAIREGKSKGLPAARPLLPPMPWVNLINMSDDDVEAIFAYLKSIPAVSNNVPAPVPPVAN